MFAGGEVEAAGGLDGGGLFEADVLWGGLAEAGGAQWGFGAEQRIEGLEVDFLGDIIEKHGRDGTAASGHGDFSLCRREAIEVDGGDVEAGGEVEEVGALAGGEAAEGAIEAGEAGGGEGSHADDAG